MTTKTATKKAAVTQAPADNPLEAARAEVERLNSAELRFGLVYRKRSAVLADLRASRGREVYDAADPGAVVAEVNARIRTLEDELDGYADAATEARKARLVAIGRLLSAECDEQVRQADQLETEAARLEGESTVLRDALQAHDDWPYVVASPVFPERAHGGVQQGGSPVVVDARGPKFMRLRSQADALRSQAAQGRYRQAHAAGSVGGTIEEVVTAIHSDPLRLGPSVSEVLAWFVSKGGQGATMTMRIEWRNGALDQAQSYVIVPRGAGAETGNTTKRAAVSTRHQIDAILGDPVEV